jgi:histone-lysine N-methyltransferase MLL3
MFRLNDDNVVDATISGGLARYINHCCDPNCVAETVCLDKDEKIVIIANKRIAKGEEVNLDLDFFLKFNNSY